MTKNKTPKTTRRKGVKRKKFPPFYLTSAAEAALGEIPNGQKSAYINKAIEQYAKDPTKQKEEK